MLDIHHYEQKLVLARKKVQECDISDANKQNILLFEQSLLAEGLSKPRIIKYLCYLRLLAILLAKDFASATRDDLQHIIVHVNQQSYSPWTVQGYKVILKRFYQWLHHCPSKKYPDIVDWISIALPKNKLPRRTPHEFPEADDVAKLVSTAKKTRDRALIASIEHLYYQTKIAEVLEKKGYRVEKEAVLDNCRSDLLVDKKIAVEIETGKSKHWLKHVENHLAAKRQVIIAATNQHAYDTIIEKLTGEHLHPHDLLRIIIPKI